MKAGDIMRSGDLLVEIVNVQKDHLGHIPVRVRRDEGSYGSWVDPDSLVATSAPIVTPVTVDVPDVGTVTISPPLDGEEFCRAIWSG